MGLPALEFPDFPEPKSAPKRAPRLRGGGGGLAWDWSRGAGFRWEIRDARACGRVADLEVQEDLGFPGPFEAGEPPRPRVFEARHMRPVAWSDGDVSGFLLERELKLPLEPGGRRRPVSWRLSIRFESSAKRMTVDAALTEPVPGQRYRLRFPVPFWPRPVEWVDASGGVRREAGLVGATGTLGRVDLCSREGRCSFRGPGLREFELMRIGNDVVLALTLARLGTDRRPPAEIRRRIFIEFPD